MPQQQQPPTLPLFKKFALFACAASPSTENNKSLQSLYKLAGQPFAKLNIPAFVLRCGWCPSGGGTKEPCPFIDFSKPGEGGAFGLHREYESEDLPELIERDLLIQVGVCYRKSL